MRLRKFTSKLAFAFLDGREGNHHAGATHRNQRSTRVGPLLKVRANNSQVNKPTICVRCHKARLIRFSNAIIVAEPTRSPSMKHEVGLCLSQQQSRLRTASAGYAMRKKTHNLDRCHTPLPRDPCVHKLLMEMNRSPTNRYDKPSSDGVRFHRIFHEYRRPVNPLKNLLPDKHRPLVHTSYENNSQNLRREGDTAGTHPPRFYSSTLPEK